MISVLDEAQLQILWCDESLAKASPGQPTVTLQLDAYYLNIKGGGSVKYSLLNGKIHQPFSYKLMVYNSQRIGYGFESLVFNTQQREPLRLE